MHPRIHELLNYIDGERAKLHALVDSIPPERGRVSPGPNRWSVAQVIGHLAVVEGRVTAMFRKKIAEARAAGVGAESDSSPVVDTLNLARFTDRTQRITAPSALDPKADTDILEARAALDAAHGEFREVVLNADGLALGDIVAPHLAFGPINLYAWIGFIGAHDARHAKQIREIEQSLQSPA